MPRSRSRSRRRSIRSKSRSRSTARRSRGTSRSRSGSRRRVAGRLHGLRVSCPKGRVYHPGADKCLKSTSRTGKALKKKIACFRAAQKHLAKCAKGLGANFV